MITRRHLLGGMAAAGGAASAAGPPRILLRSGWQTVNIGDIAHTPGVLALIEKHIPDAPVTLWPAEIDRGAEPMLMRRFPQLQIVKGGTSADGQPQTPELRDAFAECRLCIHGSAASVTSIPQMQAWKKTGRPYGFFGIGVTLAGEAAGAKLDERVSDLLTGARFVFTRETASLENLKTAGIRAPRQGFAPDGTFSFDIRDDEKGDAFLKAAGLEPGRFIALIPRLRITPYHLIRKIPPYGPEEVRRRTEINEKHAETDHAKLREVAEAWVRKTGGKALLCPEMTYALDIIDALLYRPLPADVKPRVVARKTYWLPDEAASVYAKAAAVVSFECHSPIIAASAGTPCVYVHQPEDGIKGHMWADVGLADWYFEVEQASGADIAARVLEMGSRPDASRRKVADAVAFARRKQAQAMTFARAVAAG